MSDNPASWSQLGLGSSGQAVIAQGKITVAFDPSSRTTIVNTARVLGQQIKRELDTGTKQGADSAKRNLEGLNATLTRTAGLFAGIFTAGAIFSATRNVNLLTKRFQILIGNQQEAAAEMERLRDFADDMNQPFLDVLESSTGLIPALKGTNAELSKALLISQKLQFFDPAQGAQGASIALREFLSGDIVSLSKRFEISRKDLQRIIKESNGDIAVSLDMLGELLNGMGATDDALREMGEADPFRILASEGKELIAQVFEPMLTDFAIPLVRTLSEGVRAIREADSEAVRLAITFAGILTTVKAINTSGIAGAGISNRNVAMLGGAGLAFEGGILASRELAKAGVVDNPDLANDSQGEAREKVLDTLGMATVAAADTFVSFVAIVAVGIKTFENAFNRFKLVLSGGAQVVNIGFLVIKDQLYDIRDGFVDFLQDFRSTLALVLSEIGGAVSRISGTAGDALFDASNAIAPRLNAEAEFGRSQDNAEREQAIRDAANSLAQITEQLQNSPLALTQDQAAKVAAQTEDFRKTVVGGLFDLLFDTAEETADAVNEVAGAIGEIGDAYTEDQLEAFTEYHEELGKIQEEAQQDRLEAEKNYQEERSRIIDDFNQQAARDQEDEARRLARAQADLERSITDARTQAIDRESEIIRGAQDKITEIHADFQQNEIKREEDFARTRERRIRDLQRGLREAASRLDASAVLRLLQANRDRAQDEREGFDRQTDERSKERDERIAQVQQETAEQLQANRDAADQRIAEMRQQFAREEALRAEDRSIRLARQMEDHQAQLAQLDANHQERLVKIDEQATRESDMVTQQFIDTFNQLATEAGQHNGRMIAIQRAGLEGMEQQLFMFVSSWQQRMGQMTPTQPFENTRKTVGRWFAGGTSRVSHTGMFGLERGESVIPAHTAEMMRRSMGGEITPVGLAAAMNGGSSRNIQFNGDMKLEFGDIGGYSPQEIAAIVRGEFMNILKNEI